MTEHPFRQSHWPRSLRDILYRSHLLRRLTFVCAAILWAGLGVAMAVHDQAPGGGIAVLAVICIIGPALHNVLFPGGYLDALAGAIAVAIWFSIWPLFLPMLSASQGPLAGVFMAVGPMATWLIALKGLTMTYGLVPMGELRVTQDMTLPVPAGALKRHAMIAPETDLPERRTGPVDENGIFPVWAGFRFPDNESFDLAADSEDAWRGAPDYHARILEQSDTHQVAQYIMSANDIVADCVKNGTLVARTEIRPMAADLSHLRHEEVHDLWDAHTWVSGWLHDQARDHYRELADLARGVPTPAVRHLPQVTLVSLIARLFVRAGLAPQSGGDA